MLGLLATGAVAFVMMPKRPKYLAALAITCLLSARFIGPELATRYTSVFASEGERDSSSESRLDLWKSCLQVIGEYPVFGVGPANWRVIAANYGWPEGKSAHSVWMETGAELGIPGTLFLMVFFGSTVIRLWPVARAPLTDENRYEVVLASGVILAIVGFAVSGQFVSVPGLEVPYYVTMLGAAMLKTTRPQAVASTQGAVAGTRFSYGIPSPLPPVR
jgi:O-antigen ligase